MTHVLAKQLDELMGVNRNGDRQNLIIKDFFDKRVCKFDLCGLCPHTLFPNTKQDLGKCRYEMCPVPDNFKRDYQEERKKHDFGYEKSLEEFLESLQRECDERIARAQRRLEVQQKNQITNEPIELKNVRMEIETMTKQLDDWTNEGEIDKAQELMERLDALKKEKEQIEAKMPNTKEQQLIVCEVCAALLSVNESDQRLADHFAGKMHLGFQKIRDKLKELKEMRSFDDRRQRDTDRLKHRKGGHVADDFERDYDSHRKRRDGDKPTYSAPSYSFHNRDHRERSPRYNRDSHGGDRYHNSRSSHGGRDQYNRDGGGRYDRYNRY